MTTLSFSTHLFRVSSAKLVEQIHTVARLPVNFAAAIHVTLTAACNAVSIQFVFPFP